MVAEIIRSFWTAFWMRFAGRGRFGRIATWFATCFAPPYQARIHLSYLNRRGYVAPSATLYHTRLILGEHVFIGDRVIIFQARDGGLVELGDHVRLYGDVLLETGPRGSIALGAQTRIHRGCHLIAYEAPIRIGRDVEISQNCAFYSYDKGFAAGERILAQPLQTKGPIVIGDHVWLGVGVIVLSGVRIGNGVVMGAGSVVTRDIPDGAIAVGVPARVVKMRVPNPRPQMNLFTPEDSALVSALASLIVPSDETGPGAREANVGHTLERLVATSQYRREFYPRGLLAFDMWAERAYKRPFKDLSHREQLSLLRQVDGVHRELSGELSLIGKIKRKLKVLSLEQKGLFPAVELFPDLVRDVLQAFYTSQVAWDWLGYDGPPMPRGYPDLVSERPPERDK